jgi:DNA-binding NarL/FixJ family response regulator
MMYSEQRQIRLFIVDPQPLIAAALSQLFGAAPEMHVVGTAQQAKAAMLTAVVPDVIMLSHDHGTTDMRAMIEVCKAAVPTARICVISCHEHPELLQLALDAGADGYSIKNVEPAELLAAIHTIASGTMYVDPRVGGLLLRQRGSYGPKASGTKHLSSREVSVVKLIANGMSNKEISSELDLSEKTIKNHVSRIFEKLNMSSRTQVVVHAIKTGIA